MQTRLCEIESLVNIWQIGNGNFLKNIHRCRNPLVENSAKQEWIQYLIAKGPVGKLSPGEGGGKFAGFWLCHDKFDKFT